MNKKIIIISIGFFLKPVERYIQYNDIESINLDKKLLKIEGSKKVIITIFRNHFFDDFEQIVRIINKKYNSNKSS